jgi:hypothetical protein
VGDPLSPPIWGCWKRAPLERPWQPRGDWAGRVGRCDVGEGDRHRMVAAVVEALRRGVDHWLARATSSRPIRNTVAIRRVGLLLSCFPRTCRTGGPAPPPFPSPAVPARTWSAYVSICILELGVTGQLNSVFRVNAKRCNNLSRRPPAGVEPLSHGLEAPSHRAMPVTT